MTSTQPKDVVRRYFAALAAGDQQAVEDSWAEDGSCWYAGELPISGLWQGRDQVINGFLATAFAHLDPDREVGLRVTNLFGEGDQVFVEWDSWATGRTGRPYQQKNSGVFTVREGRIASMREYADTQHWYDALVAEAPAEQPAG
ncbi:nuclear transport factor 2 family protein [Kitasatospora acidiphila]|uniref:Nuclear transport factor 2 family protein n=1 Tax=Kitasatospora acidiphila TaxID=2567942 RepID=A0A540WGP9_9ACTN|nr:nuclear transport factor 2 family protein [Kitasatospora acidiphila]TQF08077.1 nuclear transport factor 2 family protein [Kitasatospora acidiphila]